MAMNTCEQYLATLAEQQRQETAKRLALAERCGMSVERLDALLSKSHEHPGAVWRT